VVWVKASELRAITAYDNAEVKSFGTLSPIELTVSLHNNASAQLNLDAYSANVTVADHAKADLSGKASTLTLNHDVTTSVNKYNFTAAHYNEKISTPAKTIEMAGI
jgi:hypothetical protein